MPMRQGFRRAGGGAQRGVATLLTSITCALSGNAWADKSVIIVFDVPGAAGEVPVALGGTFPYAINAEGAMAGYYTDANAVSHAFIRSPRGQFATFDAPGAGTLAQQGTSAYSINGAGSVSGSYTDSNGVGYYIDLSQSLARGFVRLSDE